MRGERGKARRERRAVAQQVAARRHRVEPLRFEQRCDQGRDPVRRLQPRYRSDDAGISDLGGQPLVVAKG